MAYFYTCDVLAECKKEFGTFPRVVMIRLTRPASEFSGSLMFEKICPSIKGGPGEVEKGDPRYARSDP